MKLRALLSAGLWLVVGTASADVALYDVDAKNAKEISDAIRDVLRAQCTNSLAPTVDAANASASKCRASLLPTGQLLVEAPVASQTQIAAVLKQIASRDVSPTPRVTLHYWVIYGEPGKPGAPDAALKPLDSVLQQLERVHGPLGFSVLDTASITTQSGTSANAQGDALQINERVRANGDAVSVSIELSFAQSQPQPQLPPQPQGQPQPQTNPFYTPPAPQRLNVEVTIRRGEYLVLGERTARDKSGRLFYVVQWPQGQ